MPATKAKRKTKGKQHPVRSQSFIDIADKLKEHAKNPLVDTNSPSALLLLIADVFATEGKQVQKIVR